MALFHCVPIAPPTTGEGAAMGGLLHGSEERPFLSRISAREVRCRDAPVSLQDDVLNLAPTAPVDDASHFLVGGDPHTFEDLGLRVGAPLTGVVLGGSSAMPRTTT